MAVPWQSPSRQSQIRGRNNFEGGVNASLNSFDIAQNESVQEYGWDFDQHPSMATRKGRTAFGTTGGATTRLLTNFGNTHLLRAVGTVLQYWNGAAWTNIPGTFADADWDAANFDIGGPALILTNGTDTPRYWNGSTLQTLTGSPPLGRYIAADNLRVYMAVNDEISYCAFQNALDWTTSLNAGTVQFYTPNGGKVTGLKSFEGVIYAFKKDAFALIFHTGNAKATHRLQVMSNDIGCDSYKTIQEVGSYLLWKGANDVYLASGGAAIGIGDQKVRRYLKAVNASYADRCCAWTDGNRYYLCLVTGANTQPDTELVYDIRYKKWRVRNIALGGMVYGALLNNVPYGGWADGMTYKLNDGTTDNGTAISYLWESKPFDFGMMEAEKEFYEAHIQGFIDTGTSLTFSVSTEDRGESFSAVDTMTAGTSGQNKDILIPLDTVPLTNWLRYRLTGSGYVELNEAQLYARIQPVQH